MPDDRESFSSEMDVVDNGFFATTGIELVRGRGFPPHAERLEAHGIDVAALLADA